MANSIAFAKSYTGIIDEVHKRSSVSACLMSGARVVRAGRGAHDQDESNAIEIVCAFRKTP